MRLLAALLIIGLAACSKDQTGGGGNTDGSTNTPPPPPPAPPGTSGLRLEPANVALTTDGVTPARQGFTVLAVKQDGSTEDVSTSAVLTLAPAALGMMRGATFETTTPGRGTLTASLGSFTAEATIAVQLRRVVTVPPDSGQPALPSDPGGIVGVAPNDPTRAPELVYPNDGVLFPPNLGAVEVHYRRGSQANSLFAISFTTPIIELAVYTRCAPLADGCFFVLGADLWSSLASAAGGLDPISVRVIGTDDTGTGAGTSNSIAMNIAAFPVQGGLYYWTTSNGTAIMRVDFGAAQQQPERFFPFQGGGCFGCHALSRNGRRMTLSQNGQGDGRMFLIDVASQNILLSPDQDQREQFQTWNPTSDKFAGIFGDGNPVDTNIRIRNGDTGLIEQTIPIGDEVSHPDWSPRGDRIAFTLVTRHQTSQRPGRGGISYVAQNGGTWSAPMTLIAPEDGKNRYYPAYSPDGRIIVYDESTCPGGEIYDDSCDADADPSAKLWAIPADGGNRVVLDRANAPGLEDRGRTDLSNTFPKWAPFSDPRTRDGQGTVVWFTFSSRRSYGLRSPNGSDLLLWMAAVDPEAVLAGRDGSYAAFALPFQDLGTSNHIAQWTTRIVPSSPDGGPGDDDDGGVDPGNGGSCKPSGDPCDPMRDTCCGANICAPNGPGIYVCRPNV